MGSKPYFAVCCKQVLFLCFDKMVEGIDGASKLIQYGWETITEGLKQ
jgi:ketol-acid reductoisomerase